MIPADLSARLRMLTEASFFSKEPPEVGALRSAREIPEELPEFAAGQRITASLREARTDESFRALIAGKEFTLLLPKSLGARAGQTLELIVAQSTPRGVLANVAPSDTAGVSTSLSQTARLIGFLLTGQPPAAAARLAAGQPLMPSPTGAGHVLAPVLRQAVAESGLFYEAQMVRWLAGAVSTDSLLRQPQGQQPRGSRAASASTASAAPGPGGAAASTVPASTASGHGEPSGKMLAVLGGEQEELAEASRSTAAQRNPNQSAASTIPERLLPVVHQQLDALASHQYAWQGTLWPGQLIQWEIDEPIAEDGTANADDENRNWSTTLRLTMPRLGGIEAQLHLTSAGVAMRLETSTPATAQALRAAEEALSAALAAANVPLTGLTVGITTTPAESAR